MRKGVTLYDLFNMINPKEIEDINIFLYDPEFKSYIEISIENNSRTKCKVINFTDNVASHTFHSVSNHKLYLENLKEDGLKDELTNNTHLTSLSYIFYNFENSHVIMLDSPLQLVDELPEEVKKDKYRNNVIDDIKG